MMLWFLRGMAGDKPVKISASLRQRFGVGRKAVGRALTALDSFSTVPFQKFLLRKML